jgi:hypothetical protein
VASPRRIFASAALAVALVATFALGAHHNLPSRRAKTTWAFPGVTTNAVERGCAAWNESIEACLSDRSSTNSEFSWPER